MESSQRNLTTQVHEHGVDRIAKYRLFAFADANVPLDTRLVADGPFDSKGVVDWIQWYGIQCCTGHRANATSRTDVFSFCKEHKLVLITVNESVVTCNKYNTQCEVMEMHMRKNV